MKHTKYYIFEKFISDDECSELSQWILNEQSSSSFIRTAHPGTIRKTTRYSFDAAYPKTAYLIQERIKQELAKLFSVDVELRSDFKEGMYASYGIKGDKCSTHTDDVVKSGYITYHFNIILSDYQGGDVVVEDRVVKLNRKDAILYPVSELEHSTTRLTGEEPRLFWCFGFCVPE